MATFRFSGCLLLVLFTSLSAGWAGDNRTLVGNRAVQRELKLSDDQLATINSILAKMEEEIANLKAASGKATDAERIEQVVLAKRGPDLQAVLNGDQANRLWQIGAQASGPGVFNNPRTIRLLMLTREQDEQIAMLLATMAQEMTKLATDPSLNLPTIEQKVQIAQQSCLKSCVAVLSVEQREVFNKLIGQPFELDLLKRSDGVKPRPLTFVFGLGGQNAFVLIGAMRKDLGLSESQSKQVQALLKKTDQDLTKTRLEVLKGADKAFPDMTAEEQYHVVKTILASAATIHRETTAEIVKVLSAEQYALLDKKLVQKIGARAIESDSIATRLELTDNQKSALTVLTDEFDLATAPLRVVRDQASFDYKSFERKLAEFEVAARQILTPAQKMTLVEIGK